MAGLKIAFVPGVTPGKWLDRWRDRYPERPLEASVYEGGDPLGLIASGDADLVFVRFPDGTSPASAATHVIPLYEELPVVCAPKDHDVELYDDAVPLDDLSGANFLDLDDYAQAGGAKMALEVVGTGAGLLVLPMSLARLYHRKDVVYRVLEGAPSTRIGLAWARPQGDDPENPEIEEFIGIVRGRAANSSRQPSVQERQQTDAAAARKKRQGSDPKAGQRSQKPGARGAAQGSRGKPGKPGKSGGSKRGKR
ncbi:LysR family transcriptional regulator [Zafaria cholistanensis]|uniref:LysR family transcriptional regulator n=1 Tax=Zafaria cholistanensis TaxID=1682741 RepID=A0A5A7NQE1_9MICC|nr:substrate-binding domain-containing protein [Zafaria cholistanensis]GER22919.1 LysR family transcriptional regulator [Zafaria cholistanensis]